MRVIIVGAGASGLAAACTAAQRGAQVLLLERHHKPGRKIYASGNGRCNIMNTGACYIHGASFAHQVINKVTRAELLRFFENIGLHILSSPEEDGRLYPSIMQSAAVVQCLLNCLDEKNVKIDLDCPVREIIPDKNGYLADTGNGTLHCDRVILACGTPAGGNLGYSSYDIMQKLGYQITPLIPSLCPIKCTGLPFKALKGLRIQAALTLMRDNQPLEYSRGELLFTDEGISGICSMQLAGTAASFPFDGSTRIILDLSPLLDLAPRTHAHLFHPPFPSPDKEKVRRYLQQRSNSLPFNRLLTGLIPDQLQKGLIAATRGPVGLDEALTHIPLTVTGVDVDKCQVIRGGVSLCDFDPATMESKRHQGLYCTGEMLDVDGDCGGYNLMFAFASGVLAGHSASERSR